MSELRRRIPAYLQDLVVTESEERVTSAYDPPAPSKSLPEVSDPHNPAFLERLVKSTPARIATGRTGTRYRTATYLTLRADHATAIDAVASEISSEIASELACLPVTSRCPDREHYLLHPNDGRRLSDESRRRLEAEGTHGADLQVIMADGLAATALAINGPRLLPSLVAALQSRGLSVGQPILARMARVGLQDDIGVLLGSRATAICLGERPGLGTGDSLSIYIAIGPKIDQDNAEKNCISNIRPQGISPEAAANLAANLIARGLELGRGGLSLV